MLSFDLASLKEVKQLELDGQSLDVPTGDHLVVKMREGKWTATGSTVDPKAKNSNRGGPFVTAFNHRVMFVYGTGGTSDSAADAYASARQLAEALYYRGNASIDVISDTEFSPAESANRNVILFGNADNNRVWNTLLATSPVQVHDGSVKIGNDVFQGDDLAAVFIRPREGSAENLIGAVASTGHGGAVVLERLPLAVSGVGLPDWTVISADSFISGMKGIRAAGYFANNWNLDPAETIEQR
jgi:hypothetical protein